MVFPAGLTYERPFARRDLTKPLEQLTAEATAYIANGGEDDVEFLTTACTRLQENNRKLKTFIATQDAEAAYEAMHGGYLGWGWCARTVRDALL